MPKTKKNKNRNSNPDFRRQANFPAPPVEEIEQQLMRLLTPAVFSPLRMVDGKKKLRERILTLPVMTAIVLTLVWRRVASLSELLRILAKEKLLWVEPLEVSKQALSKRMDSLPASLFAQLYEEVTLAIVSDREHRQKQKENHKQEEKANLDARAKFASVWIADGSTLEALKRKTEKLKEKALNLAGKIMMVVEAYSHVPVTTYYTNDHAANDKKFSEKLLEKLPVGGLLIFDLGFFSFLFFDAFTEAKKYFITRMREKTSYFTVEVLSEGKHYKDEIIEMGIYRANPCKHRVRMISVLWGKTWYRYITNVLDPNRLSARQVCELYRRRWRIEDAFLLTKRLLGLSYLWVGGSNGVEIQIYATLIFYSVLVDLCEKVAIALSQPLERISVEMVFRSLYHFARALLRGEKIDLVSFITQDAKLFAIVKAVRNRHKQAELLNQQIWEPALC
jgi:hypothetical protein